MRGEIPRSKPQSAHPVENGVAPVKQKSRAFARLFRENKSLKVRRRRHTPQNTHETLHFCTVNAIT
jgi:hypothetical protein